MDNFSGGFSNNCYQYSAVIFRKLVFVMERSLEYFDILIGNSFDAEYFDNKRYPVVQ